MVVRSGSIVAARGCLRQCRTWQETGACSARRRRPPPAEASERHIRRAAEDHGLAIRSLQPRVEASAARIALANGYARKQGQWARDMFRQVAPFSLAAFGCVIDTGHANIAGDLDEIEASVGERLISLHLNDNNGQKDAHFVGRKGTVDWSRIVRLLQTTAYDGCLMWAIGTSNEPFDRTILGPA